MEYTTRATLDIDFVDLGYPENMERFCAIEGLWYVRISKYNSFTELQRKSDKIIRIQIYKCNTKMW